MTLGGTGRQVRDWRSGEDRTRADRSVPVNTGWHIRMRTHIPWVVGSSPTRPTEVGHPTRRLSCTCAPFLPVWFRPSDGLSGGCEREMRGSRDDLGPAFVTKSPVGNAGSNPWVSPVPAVPAASRRAAGAVRAAERVGGRAGEPVSRGCRGGVGGARGVYLGFDGWGWLCGVGRVASGAAGCRALLVGEEGGEGVGGGVESAHCITSL